MAIKLEEPLGERNSELLDRHSEVRCDFWEIPGHTSASGKETMSRSEMTSRRLFMSFCSGRTEGS
jgi:hypothetical protein